MTQQMNDASFDALLRQAAGWRLQQALATLPTEESLRAEFGSLTRLDRRIKRSLRALRRQKRTLPQTSWHTMRRIALVAALLAAMMIGTLAVSAELRLMVKNTVVDWMERNMSIRYEVEGHPLTALPEGYAPHYIPEGFVYSEEDSFEDEVTVRNYYNNEEGFFIVLDVWVAEGASVVQSDTEHTFFRQVEYGDGDAWFGTFEDGDGYMFSWIKGGIEHNLYINAVLPESEVFQIADHIY